MNEQWLSNTVIDESLPSCLDSIIRRNRESGSLHLTTHSEIASIEQPIDCEFPVKMHLYDWSLITLSLIKFNISESNIVFALGQAGDPRKTVVTSVVEAVDLDNGLIRTRNSIYSRAMASAHIGEPDQNGLMMICAHLVARGAGRHFGIPALFLDPSR